MKYEKIDTIYFAKKNNGESLVINKIKWPGEPRYDLRIWDGDIPLSGVVLSGKEISELSEVTLRYRDIKTVMVFDESDFAPNGELNECNLRELLEEFPDCLQDRCSLEKMLDSQFGDLIREKHLILDAYDSGIAKEIEGIGNSITPDDITRFINRLDNWFGIKAIYAIWAIKTWAKAFNVRCNSKDYIENYLNKLSEVKQKMTHLSTERNNIIFSEKNLIIEYVKSEKGRFLAGRGYSIYLLTENKSDEILKVKLTDIKIDGFVVESSTLLNSNILPKSKAYDNFVIFENKVPGGFNVDSTCEFTIQYQFKSDYSYKESSRIRIKFYNENEG